MATVANEFTCGTCKGSGTLVYRADNLRYVGPGPLPDGARGFVEQNCTSCGGVARFDRKTLDERGRCCGCKPHSYKRPQPYLICLRCNAQYDPRTGEQQENWAYKLAENPNG